MLSQKVRRELREEMAQALHMDYEEAKALLEKAEVQLQEDAQDSVQKQEKGA